MLRFGRIFVLFVCIVQSFLTRCPCLFRSQILVSLIYLKGRMLCFLRLRDLLPLWLQNVYKVSATVTETHSHPAVLHEIKCTNF